VVGPCSGPGSGVIACARQACLLPRSLSQPLRPGLPLVDPAGRASGGRIKGRAGRRGAEGPRLDLSLGHFRTRSQIAMRCGLA